MAPRDRAPGAAGSCWESHSGYSREQVDTFLDMLGLIVFIIAVIALAAGVTALVVKISPTKDKKAAKQQQADA